MRKLLLTILALVALALAGCGSDSSSSTESSTSFQIPTPGGKAEVRYEKNMHIDASGLSGPEPKPVTPRGSPPQFLALNDLIEGIGHLYHEGEKVTVQYVGYDYEIGKKFASSWEEGKPFTFTLGKGEVIEGWEEGLLELEGGDRRELVVPPSETKGKLPPGIPQGKTVIFVVEPLPTYVEAGRKRKAEAPPPKSPTTPASTSKTKPKVEVPSGPPPNKLVIKDLEAGKGPAAKKGDEVSVQYVGVFYENGKEFDSSWSREATPYTFKLGYAGVIQGWEQGIVGMKVGGRRELIIPPSLAYGSQQTGAIPPNSTLIFVIDLVEIK